MAIEPPLSTFRLPVAATFPYTVRAPKVELCKPEWISKLLPLVRLPPTTVRPSTSELAVKLPNMMALNWPKRALSDKGPACADPPANPTRRVVVQKVRKNCPVIVVLYRSSIIFGSYYRKMIHFSKRYLSQYGDIMLSYWSIKLNPGLLGLHLS